LNSPARSSWLENRLGGRASMVSPQATSEAESRDALFTLGKATTCFPQEEWARHTYCVCKPYVEIFSGLRSAT